MKANWASFVDACDKYPAEAGETSTVEQDENTIRDAVNKASVLLIPAGCILQLQPTLPDSAKSLADERDRKRSVLRSKQADPQTAGGRQVNQIAIRPTRAYGTPTMPT